MNATRQQPEPPFQKEELTAPGIEENMVLKPKFEGHRYKSAKKLEGKVALITGAKAVGRKSI